MAPEAIAAGLVRVAERDGRRLGFSAVLEIAAGVCELDGLFVEPDAMRHGVGRALIADVVARAGAAGATSIAVIANPRAVEFYDAVGFGPGAEASTRFGPAHWMHRPL